MTDVWDRRGMPESIKDVWDHDPAGHSWLELLRAHYKPIEAKADALDKVVEILTVGEGDHNVIFPLDKFVAMKKQADNWRDLKTSVIQKSEDGKEWRSLNVMTMIEIEEKLKTVIKACRQMDNIDVAHKDDELAKLPRRILKTLEIESD